jgi:hypothetical protein
MKIQLPRELESRFGRLRGRLLRVQSLETVLAVFVFLALSFLIVFVADRLADTVAPIRFAALVGGLVLAGLAAFRWVFRWVLAPPGIKRLAVLVQRRYRQLGDRLLGIVELANESARPANFSEELYEAAIDQVSTDALNYDFEGAVSTRLMRRLVTGSVGLAIVFAILAVLVPGAAGNALARWMTPHRDIPRYTLVRIQDLEATGVVVHGEPFEVTAKVDYLSFWKPKVALARFGNEPALETKVENGQITIMVPSQHEPRTLELTLGDVDDVLPIEPVFRPKLVDVGADATLPSYLGYSSQELKIAGGVLEVLEGSEVTLSGEISRGLDTVTLRLGETGEQALTIDGATFSSGPLNLTNLYDASLTWKDELGLENTDPWKFTIRHAADQAPMIDLPELGYDTAILDTEVLALRVVTRDDFGVNEFGLNWHSNEGPQPSQDLLQDEFHDGSIDQSQMDLDVTFYFSPAIYEIPAGATVEFKGFVTDYFPEREPVESAVYRVHIVSSAEHAELIRARLESLLTNLEEISRLQEKLAAASEELRENPDLDPAAIENRLQDQLDDQAMNAAQLSQVAQQGLETLREAMRNTEFSDEMMKEWTETMSTMQSLAQQKMSEASKSLSAAKKSPTSRSQNLADAQQKQEEILKALEEMQSEVNEDLDQMEAMTIAQRLRAIGSGETEIEEALMKQASETIGLFPEELAPRFQAANERLSEVQARASEESKSIQEEISRFFERTEREAYGIVSEGMKESDIVEKLLIVQELIKDNVTMQATEDLAEWSSQFDAWADELEPEQEDDPSSGGGGGGGGGEDELDLTKHLMALLRLRESELTLRIQTRLLNRKREDPEFLEEQIGDLTESQVRIQDRLVDVLLENPLPDLDKVLDEAHVEMDSVIDLLNEQQTGDPTVAGETGAINDMTDAINIINEQAQKKSSSSSSMAQQMAMMMQMAAMAKGQSMSQTPSGSGSPAGGDTDQAAEGQEGETRGAADDARGVSRAAGMTDNLPTEFRHVFEHYFRELEALEATLPMPTVGGSPNTTN